jgi:indole-3-glycerol phosphate synthase
VSWNLQRWRIKPVPRLPENNPNRKAATLELIVARARASIPGLQGHRLELERQAAKAPPLQDVASRFRGPQLGLIAEVKRRSPSAGEINATLDPVALAKSYQAGGAAMISVLTNGEFFGGSVADLDAVTRSVDVPVLRKEFIVDELQLLEARALGASAVLLIVAALDIRELARLLRFAGELGLAVLVEAHTAAELDCALDVGAELIGVNARDLSTFQVDTARAWELLNHIPPRCVAIAESGMASVADAQRAAAAGADGVLIGSALSGAVHPEAICHGVSEIPRHAR